MRLYLLISPLTAGAFFGDAKEVALGELSLLGLGEARTVEIGGLVFLEVEAEEDRLRDLARLSFVQGLFAVSGEALVPLDQTADFLLAKELVFGQKYQGKTNELVTQLAINVGLGHLDPSLKEKKIRLLDPMAGRGTTLLWAARYGMDARGIEIDEKAKGLFEAHVKTQCKLSRIRQSSDKGRAGKLKAQGTFVRFDLGGPQVTLVHGNSGEPSLLEGRRFSLIIADLPYGIHHQGRDRRNPTEIVAEVAPTWAEALSKGGAMVLIANTLQTRRDSLIEVFSECGLVASDFRAPHRMSASILRDLLVLTRPLD